MAQSGWYDDPDGTPGRLRYWDGTQWTPDTMPRPAAVPPEATAVLPPQSPAMPAGPTAPAAPYGPAAPSAPYASPASYGPQGPRPAYTPGTPYAPLTPGQAPKRPRGRGPAIAITAVALLLLVGLAIAVNGLLRPATPGGSTTPGRMTPLPSTFPTVTKPSVTVPGQSVQPTIPDPSDGQLPTPAACPTPASGTLSDGTMSVTLPKGWTPIGTARVEWSECPYIAGRDVAANWMTSVIVASAAFDHQTAEQAAQAAWDWNLGTNYENSTSPVRITDDKITSSEDVTMGGLKGHKLTGAITISGLAGVKGDDVTILVLDKPDGSHSVLITMSTIGDAASKAEVASVWSSLKVS